MSKPKPSKEKKEFNVDLKSLEIPIEKYPMAESKNMFESFLIIGYDEPYYQENIIDPVLKLYNETAKNLKENEKMTFPKFYCRNLPTLLSSISSDFTGPMLNGNQIIEKVFPIPPPILLEIDNSELPKDKKYNFVIFSNIQNEVVNYGFGFIFHEKKIINEKLKVNIPKAFVIISQYPLFNIFNKLCKEIKELFNNQQLQIPIEIQIYNIINYVPASIESGLKMTLIPKLELSQINLLKNQDEFFSFEKQERYISSQLNGYRSTEINFCYLLNIISIELLLEIYLYLICGKIIGFFYENITDLSIILHVFHQFLFPFAPSENVSCLPPLKFFCNETVDQSIVGFLCNYDDLDKFDPFRELGEGEFRCLTMEEENSQLDPLYFQCDFIFDLNKRELKIPDKYSNDEDDDFIKNKKILNDYIKKLIGKISKKNAQTKFEKKLSNLYDDLKKKLLKLTTLKKMKKVIFNPFIPEDVGNIRAINNSILESFYQFNLNLAYMYYQTVSQYNGDYKISKEKQINTPLKSLEESGLNKEEYIFFTSFGNSLFGNCLDNFVGGFSQREPKIYKASKLIFENLLYTLKIKKFYEKEEDKKKKTYVDNQIILDIYDELYTNKIKDYNTDEIFYKNKISEENLKEFLNDMKEVETNLSNMNHRTFTFYEFFKYYFTTSDIAPYFFNVSNPEFVSGKIIKNNKNNIKYIFKYKKIALDQNILFKYIYKLKQMDNNKKEKFFKKVITAEIIKKDPIKSYENFISAGLEKYYIDNKLIDNIELINFSILGIVILTVSKHNLINYIEDINQIIKNLTYLTRTFVKILLSISLRVFSKEKEKNLFIYEKYFDIYKTAIKEKNIFPNDDLIILQKKIDEFKESVKTKETIEIKANIKNKKFALKYNDKFLKKFSIIELNQELDLEERAKEKDKDKDKDKDKRKKNYLNINFEYGEIKFESAFIYSSKKIYEKICNFLDAYYKDLDYNIILNEKEEFNKLIIYLLFYVELLKGKKDKKHIKNDKRVFTKDIESFLIDCLEN